MGKALLVIIGMFGRFRNPSAITHLVQLTNSVLENIEFDPNVVNTIIESPQVAELLKTHEEVLIYHVCSFLEHLLNKTDRPEIVVLALRFVRSHIEKTLDNPEVIYSLWISSMRSLEPSSPFIPETLQLLEAYQNDIMSDHPTSFCELMQEYLLLRIINPTEEHIVGLVLSLCLDSGDQP